MHPDHHDGITMALDVPQQPCLKPANHITIWPAAHLPHMYRLCTTHVPPDVRQVYFNESAEVARTAVADVLGRWQALLGRVSEDDQAKLQRSMGLKIEQLKAELKELDDLHA